MTDGYLIPLSATGTTQAERTLSIPVHANVASRGTKWEHFCCFFAAVIFFVYCVELLPPPLRHHCTAFSPDVKHMPHMHTHGLQRSGFAYTYTQNEQS